MKVVTFWDVTRTVRSKVIKFSDDLAASLIKVGVSLLHPEYGGGVSHLREQVRFPL
jgi:hypothetical protein